MFTRWPSTTGHLLSACERYAGPWAEAVGRWQDKVLHSSLANTTQTPTAGANTAKAAGNHDEVRLEAILFLAREPLASRKLSQYANLADGTQARTLVRRLNEQYDAAGRAFRVEHVAGGYQLLTRKKLAPWLQRLAHVPCETRLSAPALETLAVIAYRQPVPRADIEAIRGVNCGEILRQLMDRDLVRIGSRSEELGRPYLYATTKRFLELFGLNQIDDLPRGEQLRASPLPMARNTNPPPSGTEATSLQAVAPGVESSIDETCNESAFE